MLVVHASAVVAACLSESGWDTLAGRELAAPSVVVSEVSSVLHEARWRGEISLSAGEEALQRLTSAPVRLYTPDDLHAAWEIADRLGWAKTYDAEYVALSMRLRCPLLTVDERLRRGVRNLIEVVRPTDL